MSGAGAQFAERLIEERRTLVFATSGADGPWAAPVYYLWRDGCFWLFSSPRSRHVTEALECGRCAAAIFRDGDDWRAIEGLQLEGSLEEVDAEDARAEGVFEAYVERFPTVRSFFEEGEGVTLGALLGKFRSRLYAFKPGRAFYLNNAKGFGKREEIRLGG